MSASLKGQMVVFDWAGTLVDYGCLAPARAFLEAFAKSRLMLTMSQVRWSMGLHNYEHIHTLFEMPPVSEQFQAVHGRPWNDADVLNCYDDLNPLLLDACHQYSHLTPGVLDVVAQLRARGLKIAASPSASMTPRGSKALKPMPTSPRTTHRPLAPRRG